MTEEELAAQKAAEEKAAEEAAAKAAAKAAEEEAAAKAAEEEAEAKAAEEAAALKAAEEGNDSTSDREAELLKESMGRKKKLKEKEAEIAELTARLSTFDGIDAEAIKKLVAADREKEDALLVKAGEFDVLKKRMGEEHEKQITSKDEEIETLRALIKKNGGQIDDLTVGHAFDNDTYIQENLILTPSKARIIYGSHFDINDDGQIVGHSKPVGSAGAEPFVDSAGDPLSFTDVIKKLIEADPDRDAMIRSKVRAGSDSKPSTTGDNPQADKPELTGAGKIEAALKAQKAA